MLRGEAGRCDLRIGHEDQDERDDRCQDKRTPTRTVAEALLSLEKNEKARSEQKTHDADDTEQQYVVSHDIEHIADESCERPVHGKMTGRQEFEVFLSSYDNATDWEGVSCS